MPHRTRYNFLQTFGARNVAMWISRCSFIGRSFDSNFNQAEPTNKAVDTGTKEHRSERSRPIEATEALLR
eukprot:947690-Rhodomonas_salina.1